EQKFSGIEELSNQIAKDVVRAKEVLREQQNELTLSCEEHFNR
ncbi:MAG TPA: riboflavin biosynthesis protein RibF, partial [Desulfocapsa sulfexigens]|nr:riboflavin biosynthesis protein RibF [Desulfocapsa sulfexigens]